MKQTYTDKRGFKIEGDSQFVDSFRAISEESDRNEEKWVEKLKKFGIKAAHPNDGWNNRKDNECSFSYPYFNLGVKVGDQIALGDCEDFVVVTVVNIKRGLLGTTYYEYHDYK